MSLFWQKLKIYLNEDTTTYKDPRYKTILLFLIGLTFFGLPIFFFFYMLISRIIYPIFNQINLIKIQYNDIFLPLGIIISCLCITWMFSPNLAVRAFASSKWTKYCFTKPRPYYNHFIYHFSKNYKKNILTDTYCFFFSLLFCLILIKLPQSFQINVDTKIMNHFGYSLCRSYIDKSDDNTLKLIFSRQESACVNQ